MSLKFWVVDLESSQSFKEFCNKKNKNETWCMMMVYVTALRERKGKKMFLAKLMLNLDITK